MGPSFVYLYQLLSSTVLELVTLLARRSYGDWTRGFLTRIFHQIYRYFSSKYSSGTSSSGTS
jgi:hypothetical protein